ncbi:MAG: putative acetyltransferase, partial [Actinomyces urogenitalis DORA_12]
LVAVSEGEEGYLAGATRWRCPVTGTVFDQSNDTIREVTR